MDTTTPSSGLTEREVSQRLGAMLAGPEEEIPEADPVEGEDVEAGDIEDGDVDAETVEQEEDGEAEDIEGPALHTVRVDGEEVQVPYDELLAGYSRQADYTRKTQALAEERRALTTAWQQARQEREQYASVLPQLRQVLEAASLGDEPDWDRAFAEDPVAAARQQYEWRKRKDQIEAVRAEEARMSQQRAEEAQQHMAQTLAHERQKLLDRVPEWRDPKVQQAEQAQLVEFGRTLGFSDNELANVTDHRAVLALRMAMQFERAKNQGRTARQRAPKIATASPGTGDKHLNSKSRRNQAMWERSTSGKVQDIAPLMGELLSRGK